MVLSGSRGHSKHPLLSHTTEAKDPTKQGWKEHVQLELPTVRKCHQGRTRLLGLVSLDEFNIIDRRGTKPDYFFLFRSWQGFGSLSYPAASIFTSEDTNSLLKGIILLGSVNTKGFGEKTFSSAQDECLCPYHLTDFPNLFVQLGNEYKSFLLPLSPGLHTSQPFLGA